MGGMIIVGLLCCPALGSVAAGVAEHLDPGADHLAQPHTGEAA